MAGAAPESGSWAPGYTKYLPQKLGSGMQLMFSSVQELVCALVIVISLLTHRFNVGESCRW